MTKIPKNHNLMVVELDQGVMVCTPIPSENHPALRSGFAGYTANPRWNASKFRAWRIGRQWRDDLSSGRMTVRQCDSMLIPTADAEHDVDEPSPNRWRLSKQLRLNGGFALTT